MTRLMHRTARRYYVCIASVLRRWVLAVALAGGACVGVASAETWDIFKTRCLAPFEKFDLPDVTGLETVELLKDNRTGMGASETGVIYALDEGALLVVDPDPDWGPVRFCSVQSKNAGTADLNSFGLWRDAQLQESRYVLHRRTSHRNQTFETTGWIEPRLQMTISKSTHGGSVTYLIAETDLES